MVLALKDLHHLPLLDALLQEITQDVPGLTIVAGIEPRELATTGTDLPASGRAMIFGILARHLLSAPARARATMVSESREALRLAPRLRERVNILIPKPPQTYDELVERAAARRSSLLILEKLNTVCIPHILKSAAERTRVVAPLQTPLRGKWVVQQLRDLAGEDIPLTGLRWVVAVQRLPMLCDECKHPVLPDSLTPHQRELFANFESSMVLFRPGQCAACGYTGRRGEISIFDVFNFSDQSRGISFEEYVAGLAAQGVLAFDDGEDLDAQAAYRLFRLLNASRVSGTDATRALQSKVAELRAASRVLERQTQASISLQEVSYALISFDEVAELANYICRKARELCGADRAVLYLLHPDQTAEIIEVNGWDARFVHQRVTADVLFAAQGQSGQEAEPAPIGGYPPGIPQRAADVEGVYIRAGLRVPLVAQHEVVGCLIFHSTVKKQFAPGEVALLTAFAHTGAVAIQRAGLIESLRDKIEQLEAAQLEIAKKERLERELELAQQVQQSMLPHIFPLVPGVQFFARSVPARQVGGDFYDVFVLNANRVGIVIADVSDKGMPAALFMALTRSLVRAEARREPSPLVVLRRVHRLLLDLSQPTMFVTIFYGVLDITARRLTYVRAGHDYPLLLRDGLATRLEAEGTVLGMLDAELVRLSEESVAVQAEDRLILYTDGLIDALTIKEEAFGRERLTELVKSHAASPLQALGEAVFRAVSDHQGNAEQFDDMTLLAVGIG